MGKHSRKSNKAIQRSAGVAVLSIGASAAFAGNASAADMPVPHIDFQSINDGFNNAVAGLPKLPAPALPALPAMPAPVIPGNVAQEIHKAVPNVADVPGVANFIPEVLQQDRQANYAAFAEIPAKKLPSEGQRIVDIAATKIGAPYVWGATGPNAFDCSGLTSWAYAQVGKHIPRTSYAQAAHGTPVAYKDLQAGDIVAFYSGATHVGIYTGHGTVINAIDYGTPLGETPLNHMPFHSAVRY